MDESKFAELVANVMNEPLQPEVGNMDVEIGESLMCVVYV